MYCDHYVFNTNKSSNSPIWRYMDFWKFINLLETKSLFFSNSSNLGDNNEGRIPFFIVEKMLAEDKINGKTFNEEIIGFLENTLRKNHLISSWTFSERESFAMWKMYAKDTMGIAIETDLDSLKNSFESTTREVNVGEVNYVNEANYFFSTTNMYYTFLTKLDFYSFENELRCITVTSNDEIAESKLVEVNLNILIKKIHISPNSKPEFQKLIELLKSSYNLNFEICYSKISDSWL